MNTNTKNLLRKEPFVLGFALIYPFFLTLIYFVALSGANEIVQKGVFVTGKTIQFALPFVWIVYLLHLPWLIRPLKFETMQECRLTIRGLLEGIGFGCIVFLFLFGLYWFSLRNPGGSLASDSGAAKALTGKLGGFGIVGPVAFILLGCFYSIIHSGLEEYYWRWFVFKRLTSYRGVLFAIVLSSLGFAAHHYLILATYFGCAAPLTWLGTFGVGVGGAYWAWNYHRYDSIWPAWISHGIIDAAIFLVGFFVIGFGKTA